MQWYLVLARRVELGALLGTKKEMTSSARVLSLLMHHHRPYLGIGVSNGIFVLAVRTSASGRVRPVSTLKKK